MDSFLSKSLSIPNISYKFLHDFWPNLPEDMQTNKWTGRDK